MKKQIYALFLILTILFSIIIAFNSISYAMENSAAVEGVRNVAAGAENFVEDAGQTIDNSVKNIGNGINDAKNRVAGALDMDNNNNNNGDYTAVRTATDGTIIEMDPTAFTWIIMAIAGIMIVGFVWYYAKQHENSYNE